MSVAVSNGIIEHAGIVQKSDNKSVIVKIISASACSGCHAENMCSLSGQQEKLVEVYGSYPVTTGDNVTVQMKRSTGFNAVAVSYVIPMIIVVLTLVLMLGLSASELVSGLVSIAILVPYYLVIWLLRKQISNKITFTLKV